jgi:quercetin dioxygenase-like cupin family protein
VDVDGPLRPVSFDPNRLSPPDGEDPEGWRSPVLENDDLRVSISRLAAPMPFAYRNGDADEVVYVHEGVGVLQTDYGPLEFAEQQYLVLPRGTAHVGAERADLPAGGRIDRSGDAAGLRPAGAARRRRPAVLVTPGGVGGGPVPVPPVGQRHPPGNGARLPPAAERAHDVPVRRFDIATFVPRPFVTDPRRATGAVLPRQRRQHRGDLLQPRRLLQPQGHRAGLDDAAPAGVQHGPQPGAAEAAVMVECVRPLVVSDEAKAAEAPATRRRGPAGWGCSTTDAPGRRPASSRRGA